LGRRACVLGDLAAERASLLLIAAKRAFFSDGSSAPPSPEITQARYRQCACARVTTRDEGDAASFWYFSNGPGFDQDPSSIA